MFKPHERVINTIFELQYRDNYENNKDYEMTLKILKILSVMLFLNPMLDIYQALEEEEIEILERTL